MKGLIVLFILYCALPGYGQDSLHVSQPDIINNKKLKTGIATIGALYLAEISYLRFVWYKDHERVPFHFYKDGKGYLQVDKFGHAYGSYIESQIGYSLLKNAGVPKNKALLYGGTLGILLQTPIEIFDGLYEGWGFSWSDMLANTAGSALFIGQEIAFNEQVLKYKFSFSRSVYAHQANGYLGKTTLESLLNDYNGHTYWLSTNVNRIVLKEKLPDWLNVAIGYSANGMFGEFENRRSYNGIEIPATKRYRQYLLSLDVDWSKIKTRSKFVKGLLYTMNFIKIPAPALELNSKGSLQGYWLYF